MRRLVVLVAALGLLLALPASAAAAKEVAVAVSLEIRKGNTAPNNCAAAAYLQWVAQKDAEAWRLEYLWNGKLEVRTLKPPFTDAPHLTYGWAPAEGSHWYLASIGSKSASEEAAPVDCTDHEVARINAFGGGTIYITVPDTPEDEEKAKEEEEKKRKEEEEKTSSQPPDDKEIPPGKRGKAKCRGKTPTIFVEPGPPTNGTARRDVIMGTPKRDVIRARGGNDLVCGLGGNDVILGGGGKDVLLGGNGADRLLGQAAADRLFGQAGVDALDGGPGSPDLCNGGSGRDRRRSPGCERRKRIP